MGYPCLLPHGTNSATALSEYASINSDLTTWLEISTSNIDVFPSCQPLTHLRNIPKYSILLPHSTISPTYVFSIYFELETRIWQPPEHSTGLICGHSYATATPASRVFSTTVIFTVTRHSSVHLLYSRLQKSPMHSSPYKICFASIAGAICISITPIPPSTLHSAHNLVVQDIM
jgi:hypothetical protein